MAEEKAEYNVAYKGLRSTGNEYDALLQALKKMNAIPGDSLGGFQRGLIVIRNPEEQSIQHAYSVAGYFIDCNGMIEDVDFYRENQRWNEQEIKERLRKGPVLEYLLELNENMMVPLAEPRRERRYGIIPHEGPATALSIERYLFEHDPKTFPHLQSQLSKVAEREVAFHDMLWPWNSLK